MEKRNTYLCETEYIDFNHPLIEKKVKELREKSDNSLDYMKQAFSFVRDEISHTWDVKKTIVSKKASDVLRNKRVSVGQNPVFWHHFFVQMVFLRVSAIRS